MSDLISRSELLKRFLVNKDGHRIPERDCDNFEVTVSIKDVKTIIKEQPTAYDINKVVEELRQRSKEYNSGVRLHGKPEEMLTDEAIEIVKQGGVSDDVCEWKFEETNGIAWHCNDKCTTYNQAYIKDLKITLEDFECKCPYCGKKIKAVDVNG